MRSTHTKQIIHQNKIDCDLEKTGYVLIATCPAREKRIRNEVQLAHALGFDHQWLAKDALNEHIRSDAFRCGSFDPASAIINPAKLARGLKTVVENLAVAVYEQTPLIELDDRCDPLTIKTPAATIRARAALLGLNGYGGSVGFMPSRIHPVHTYIVLTEPLSDADLDRIGWSKNRASLETARNFIHYFRLTADNRILFGGEDVTLFMGGKYGDTHPPTFRALEARFREYFPSLNHVKISHRWGGVLGVTLDMFPTFGQADPKQKIFHATAYNGHGVSLSNYAGKLIAPRILNAINHKSADPNPPDPFFYNRRPAAIPPDPLRYTGMHAYRAALKLQDKWQGA
jgi:glycine/D-amino acid oxidase-like deaminating enzyme